MRLFECPSLLIRNMLFLHLVLIRPGSDLIMLHICTILLVCSLSLISSTNFVIFFFGSLTIIVCVGKILQDFTNYIYHTKCSPSCPVSSLSSSEMFSSFPSPASFWFSSDNHSWQSQALVWLGKLDDYHHNVLLVFPHIHAEYAFAGEAVSEHQPVYTENLPRERFFSAELRKMGTERKLNQRLTDKLNS